MLQNIIIFDNRLTKIYTYFKVGLTLFQCKPFHYITYKNTLYILCVDIYFCILKVYICVKSFVCLYLQTFEGCFIYRIRTHVRVFYERKIARKCVMYIYYVVIMCVSGVINEVMTLYTFQKKYVENHIMCIDAM